MALRQRILPSRREYNRWVADQTLEDYALRFTAKSARRWTAPRVANTALGAVSFLALEAIGGTITLRYGTCNAAVAIVLASLVIFATGLPIARAAAREGVDIDLLTRGAGFGYLGSTATSLIYASFTFIYFAVEASILTAMLQAWFGVPPWLGYLAGSLVVIPLVTHGITLISRFQLATQPLWIVLNLAPFAALAARGDVDLGAWAAFPGREAASFGLLPVAAAASVILSLIAQIGEQVDFLRFLPPRLPGARHAALLAAGPGWIVPGALKLLAGSFLAWLALRHGLPPARAVQPAEMYRIGFASVLPWPAASLALAALFVIVSQLKINVTNAYAGSIAWSNFFSRLTHSHPGRVVWVVFNVAIALLLMGLGVYGAIERILSLYAVVASAWVGALVADLVVVKPLGLAPRRIEFKRAHLYDVNPVGTGAMLLAVTAGVAAFSGAWGEACSKVAPFVALAVSFAAAPAIARLTGGATYLARRPRRAWAAGGARSCVVCGNPFEPEDMAHCPVYVGPICSLCCTLDARCADACKPHARAGAQAAALLRRALPPPLRAQLDGPLPRFLGIFGLAGAVMLLVLLAIWVQLLPAEPAARAALASALARTYVVVLVVLGVVAWLLALAQDSRAAAQEESRRQTALLLAEVAAHRRTDAALTRAKEAAEAANLAKSRFVVGISHELRTPLNAVLGYAQILETDDAVPRHRREAVRIIRRSGEHLAGLIEGLLDISKIEAGRIALDRREVRIGEFLAQLADMFRLQAEAKGVRFVLDLPARLPETVITDETRLRQILINLLSNAVKFTAAGSVTFRVRIPGQVALFEVRDTGIGIRQGDLGRIFEPFERVASGFAGTGLGLTITKLLTEIMGGEISVESAPGSGTAFRVKLLLAEPVGRAQRPAVTRRPRGYLGPRRTLVVADDDAVHRSLIEEALQPIGFRVLAVPDAESCRRLAAEVRPDAFLLDLSMPETDGWTLARHLRADGHLVPVVVVSAHPNDPGLYHGERALHDAFLAKPLDLAQLLDTLGGLLRLEWSAADGAVPPVALPPVALPPATVAELRRLAGVGYVRGIVACLDAAGDERPELRPLLRRLHGAATGFRLDEFAALLEAAPHG